MINQLNKDKYRYQWLERARQHPEIYWAMVRKAGTADANHPAFIALIEKEYKCSKIEGGIK